MKNWRQHLHLEPPTGFLNDPNGLCYFDGKYHIYFQYCKDNAEGKSPKSWGYYTTTNWQDYQFEGEAILPDIDEDRHGAYSGTSFIERDTQYIFYTGNVKEEGNFDYITAGRQSNTILVTSKDGKNISDKIIVLNNSNYPKNLSCHIRDPKVFKLEDTYYMILGARTHDDKGCILFYKSYNLLEWEFVSETTKENMGYMWECPDWITIEGQNYLSISPQGLKSSEFQYQNVYQSGYMKASNEISNLNLETFVEWDMGFDFYAPQTFVDKDGRTILIGWFGLPDIEYENLTTQQGYQHCLTLPRVIQKDFDGKLYQIPHEIIETNRQTPFELTELPTKLPTPFEIVGYSKEDFSIILDNKLEISYTKGELKLEFYDKTYGGGRDIRRAKINSCKNIRVIVDSSSIEIFVNNGEIAMSSRFYPDKFISISSKNIHGQVYTLSPFNISKSLD
ncbi:MAG: hypothetical protein ATN36_00710 [Epulopiscium sp. Nele67-Bin005]|nr:MAG: hypothetical protein ATN36_00710 [Epulopiscium sp. Nele67-Bin005]